VKRRLATNQLAELLKEYTSPRIRLRDTPIDVVKEDLNWDVYTAPHPPHEIDEGPFLWKFFELDQLAQIDAHDGTVIHNSVRLDGHPLNVGAISEDLVCCGAAIGLSGALNPRIHGHEVEHLVNLKQLSNRVLKQEVGVVERDARTTRKGLLKTPGKSHTRGDVAKSSRKQRRQKQEEALASADGRPNRIEAEATLPKFPLRVLHLVLVAIEKYQVMQSVACEVNCGRAKGQRCASQTTGEAGPVDPRRDSPQAPEELSARPKR